MPDFYDRIQSHLGVFDGSKDDSCHSRDFCRMLATKVYSESEFPVECKQYDDAVSLLKRHNSTKNAAYNGMSPGEAIDAMRAKDEGHMNSAQIKRRMTTTKNGRFY